MPSIKARMLLSSIKQLPTGEELKLVSTATLGRFRADPADAADEWTRQSPSAGLTLFVANAANFGVFKPGAILAIDIRALTTAEVASIAAGQQTVAAAKAAVVAAKVAKAAAAAVAMAAARPVIPVVTPAKVPLANVPGTRKAAAVTTATGGSPVSQPPLVPSAASAVALQPTAPAALQSTTPPAN